MRCPSCQAENDDAADNCIACGKGFHALTRGSVLSGRYEILDSIGRGGMGVVYKAHDVGLDETVAIKVIRSEVTGKSADLARRFRSEIKLARRVTHPNVCRIHDYGQEGRLTYIVMEYVPGTDLKGVLRRQGRLPAGEALEVVRQVAHGLQAVHKHGVVHRDLKTPNIMRTPDGTVKLMDFGIAKSLAGDVTTGATATGQIVGTPEYMSPEQARGDPVDARSDIYALGVVLFELLTGQTPFHGDTPVSTIFKVLNEPPPIDGALGAWIPEPVVPILGKLLSKEPRERYATAAELVSDLERVASSLTGAGGVPASAVGTPPAVLAYTPATLTAPRAPTQRVTEVPLPVTATPAGPTGRRVATVVRPAEGAGRPRSPAGLVLLGVAALAIAVVIALYLRPPVPGPGPSPATVPASPAPQAVATPAPSTSPTASPGASPPPRPTPDPARELAALDALARDDPQQALTRALRLARDGPTSGLQERIAAYRRAAVANHVQAGAFSMKRAAVAGSRGIYEEAAREYAAALELDPANPEARTGRETATRALGELTERAAEPASDGVTFVQGETSFQAPDAAPPGLGPVPADVAVHPAQAPMPRAQLVVEVTPPRVRVSEAFTVRYALFNISAAPLAIGSVSVRNTVAGVVTGGAVDPLTRAPAPKTRTLLLETRAAWTWDLSTDWATAFTVVLDDGSVYRTTLRARR